MKTRKNQDTPGTGKPGGSASSASVPLSSRPSQQKNPVMPDTGQEVLIAVLNTLCRIMELLMMPHHDDLDWIEAEEATTTFDLPPVMISLLANSREISSRVIGGKQYFLYKDLEIYLKTHKPLGRGGDA